MELDPRLYENIVINDNDSHGVVLSYLVHNCYSDTLESLISSTGMKQSAINMEDMEKRKRILQFALELNALKAIELTEELAPGLLDKNKDLHFDLLGLHFINLLSSRNITEALVFAQQKLRPFGEVRTFVEKLENIMALLAYNNLEDSPVYPQFGMDHRQDVVERLNREILAHMNLPSYSAMERLIQQLTVVTRCLSQDHGKDAQSKFSLKDFLKS